MKTILLGFCWKRLLALPSLGGATFESTRLVDKPFWRGFVMKRFIIECEDEDMLAVLEAVEAIPTAIVIKMDTLTAEQIAAEKRRADDRADMLDGSI